MAKPNDMPEFHSVKVSLTENIPVPLPGFIPELIPKLTPKHQHPPAANAANTTGSTFSCGCALLTSLNDSTNMGGRCHV
ncbi:hypothetical protein SG34_006970 [Thalassomonas viridans]|uniref:Uncharacterized protein n=1 Tax=Thalassomonas viridans TaxID=137584 RepID=A0AAF0C8N6_9GAMM|nr:hypothetical protein [Thalassomonas viridans]WDE06642.1 hypothetical protein SG34_006970 [Thalassomonas viridans]